MADGKQDPSPGGGLRPAAPHVDGPLGSSGAAPVPTAPVPTAEPAAEPASVEPVSAKPADTAAATSDATDSKPAKPAKPDAMAKPDTGAKPDATAKSDATAEPDATAKSDAIKPAAAGAGGSGTRVLRRPHPVKAVRKVGRTTVSWVKGPVGRVILPAVAAVLLVGVAGTAGAYLVPEAVQVLPSPSATPAGLPSGAPLVSAAPVPAVPPGVLPSGSYPATVPGAVTPTGPVVAGVRPADTLAGWAQQVGTRVGIPVVAVQAYGYAELVAARTTPACRLSWTTLAAIALVESSHGSANGAVLAADGQALPAIVGLPLDGKGGRQLISDTDQGAMDGDRVFDRAMGPLQFIPTTWRENAVDADNNGVTDPNDIDDASLAAAMYLCKNGRDMTKADDWWSAILSYNDVRPYAQRVFTQANDYGVRSRT